MLNGFVSNLISDLPMLLLSLPVILFSLSFHELAHGYVSLKLGDPTARNMGRLTLNPFKHIDPIGFICMVLFHFGWASPVPINTRHFKNPRRDMAISAGAGPLSNVLLAFIFALVLRLLLFIPSRFLMDDLHAVLAGTAVSKAFIAVAILTVMLYLGVTINFSYALFNLIPIPPLDGSRIFYVFLPPKWYFGLMKYERVIAFVMLLLLWTGTLTLPLSWLSGQLSDLAFSAVGIHQNETALQSLHIILYYVSSAI